MRRAGPQAVTFVVFHKSEMIEAAVALEDT